MKLNKKGTCTLSQLHHSKKYKQYSLPITPVEEKLITHDISQNGQTNPIQLDENFTILDGYLRYQILKNLKITHIKYEQYKFTNEAEKITYITTLNRMRRHYSEYQKCQMAYPIYKKEKIIASQRQITQGKLNTPLRSDDLKGRASDIAAKQSGTSSATFYKFLEIQKSPELEKYEPALISGVKKINTVHQLITRKQRNLPKVKLPKNTHDIFLVDTPYAHDSTTVRGAAANHYPVMSIQALIEEFKKLNVSTNAIMFFWISSSIQYDTIPVQYTNTDHEGCAVVIDTPIYKAILDAAQFKVKQEFVWNKIKIGPGNWNRPQHENLLIAIKGEMPVPAELFPSIINESKKSIHSRKPDLWPMIKKMYPKRNYCELYATTKTTGVTYHGNYTQEKK